jgi:hypothetical protein
VGKGACIVGEGEAVAVEVRVDLETRTSRMWATRGSAADVHTRRRTSYSPSVIPDVSQMAKRPAWTGVPTASAMMNQVGVGSFA